MNFISSHVHTLPVNNGCVLPDHCPPGTYLVQGNTNFENQCIQCPVGQYQNETGQTSCRNCPNDTSTRRTGSQGEDQCFGRWTTNTRIYPTAATNRDDVIAISWLVVQLFSEEEVNLGLVQILHCVFDPNGSRTTSLQHHVCSVVSGWTKKNSQKMFQPNVHLVSQVRTA